MPTPLPETTNNPGDSLIELDTVTGSQGETASNDAKEGFKDPGPFLTEESVLKATKTDHQKAASPGIRHGRPRKDDLPKGSVTRAPLPMPRPPFAVFKNDSTNPGQRSKAFYNWWNGLPAWAKDRCLLYVYRLWPILKVMDEEYKAEHKEASSIDKISGSEPLQDDLDLLNKYGAGSYLMYLSESPKTTTSTPLATVWVVNLGQGRLLDNPPTDRRISDPERHLDMDNPGNKSYIEFLRMRGKLPEQQIKEKAEAEMATVQTIERMADSNKELMHEVITMAKESRKESAPATDALKNALDVVTDGAKRSNEMLHDTITSIQELRKGGGESGASLEVMMRMAMEIAEKLSSKGAADPGTMEEIRALRAQVTEMQNARIASLERRLEEKATAVTAPATSQFGTIKEGINAFKEMKSLVDDISGRGSGGDEGDGIAPGGPAWLKTAASLAPHVSSVAGTIRDIWAMWQMGQGRMPMPAQPVTPQPQPFQQPAPQPHPGPMLVQPNPQHNPPAQPGMAGTPPQPQPGAPLFGLPPDVADLLSSIKISFLNYLEGFVKGDRDEDGELLFSGDTFADWFVGGFGVEYFKNIAQFGEGSLLQAIYMYPPIAQRVSATGANPEQVKQFVHDFVAYKMEVDREDSDSGNGVPEPPSTGAA
jgi:hypothetical protein